MRFILILDELTAYVFQLASVSDRLPAATDHNCLHNESNGGSIFHPGSK
jgi:hypothetical protein